MEEMKICKVCGEKKEVGYFAKKVSGKFGVSAKCKKCVKEASNTPPVSLSYPCITNLESEIWADVKGYEGIYQVSTYGRVLSMQYNKIKVKKLMKLSTTYQGYHRLELSKNNSRKKFFVHRLVAMAFIENPNCKPEINHINGIRNDNRVENLEWCTGSENMRHSLYIMLRTPNMKGKYNAGGRPVIQMDMQGRELNTFPSIQEACRVTKQHNSSISLCANSLQHSSNGFRWKFKI